MGEETCRGRGLDGTFRITSRERQFKNVILTYMLRTASAIGLLAKIKDGDLVYGSSDFLPDVLPAFLATFFRRDIRWVQRTFHRIPPGRPIPHLAQRFSYGLIRMRADRLVTDNRILRQDWIANGTPADKISVSHPGIDLSRYTSAPSAPTQGYNAVYLGRLHRSKGVLDLIAIWSRVSELRPGTTLTLIGGGAPDVVRDLQREISSRGLESTVQILGFLDTSDVIATLHSSRMLVGPSPEEDFGMVVLEAIATGLPVAAWHLSVYDEVFSRGMIKVPIGDNERFALEVVELANDPDRRHHLAAEAEDVAEAFDWSRVSRDIARLLWETRRS